MEEPKDVEKYASLYSENKFWEKLKGFAKKAGLKVVYVALQLYYVLTSDTCSREDKLKICGALGYLILPFDLIPDVIPVLGFSDDLAALIWAYKNIKANVTPDIKAQAKVQLSVWFGPVDDKDLEFEL